MPVTELEKKDAITLGTLISRKMEENLVRSLPDISPETTIEIKADNFYPNSIPIILLRNAFRLLSIEIEEGVPAMWETFKRLKKRKAEERSKNTTALLFDTKRDLWENKESMGKYISRLEELMRKQ